MCCQLFITDKGFIYVVPMRRKSEVLQAIKQFAKEIGVPTSIIADMAGEQMSQEVRKFCNDIGTTLQAMEEGTPWSNKAELHIGLLKEAVWKDMCESDLPMCLWDYCVERQARINNLMAKDNFKLHGTTPHTVTLAEEGDISSLRQIGWYEWCMNKPLPFPTTVKYLDGSWAPLKAKVMRWPNGFSKLTGELCLDNPYDH